MVEFENYREQGDSSSVFTMPEKVNSISVNYDGGRLSIYINGKEAYQNSCAGDDFSVELYQEVFYEAANYYYL